jgi:hypothetical protein
MRTSKDQYDGQGTLLNGFDYEHQAWVKDGKYVRCGHPEPMDCGCYGREHEGESARVSADPDEREQPGRYLDDERYG